MTADLPEYRHLIEMQVEAERILLQVVALTGLPPDVAARRFRSLCAAFPYSAKEIVRFIAIGDPAALAYMRGEGV
mgnify:CR=1 FL=1